MKKCTYQEVFDASVKYFNEDDLAAKVFVDKYALQDNDGMYDELTPDDMHKRLSKEFARIEAKYPNPMSEEEIYDLLKNFKYIIPQGSPMFGIGNDYFIQSLGNCFVINSPYDSYGGICKTDQELVQLAKRRAGIGFDISNIRPKGMLAKNAAKTTDGIGVFMERFSNSCREVAQSGRRGALLQSISIAHPEIETFIDIKRDLKKVTGANISIRLTDEFLNAVKKNKNFKLRWPVESANPIIEKEVSAKDLWSKIIDSAWTSAEPGIFFWDNVIKNSPADCYAEKDKSFKTQSSNPCFDGNERFLTENGYVKFIDSAANNGGENILTDSRISYEQNGTGERPENWIIDMKTAPSTIARKATNAFITKENAPLLSLKFANGQVLKCTPDHHIATTNGMIEAQYLTPEHKILISIPETPNTSIVGKLPEKEIDILSFLCGLIAGDGCISNAVHIDFCGKDRFRMLDIAISLIDKLYEKLPLKETLTNGREAGELSKYYVTENSELEKIRISSTWLKYMLEEYLRLNKDNKLIVPEIIINNARQSAGHYYLAGLYYASGTISKIKQSGISVRLSKSNKRLLQDVQLLCHANGILTSIYRRKARVKNIKDRNYNIREQFELITNYRHWEKFIKLVGFAGHPDKEDLCIDSNYIKKYNKQPVTHLVYSEEIEAATVYCIKEDTARNVIVNTISARRCGEILMGADSCRLLVINLLSFVKDPFAKNTEFDFDLYSKITIKAQRLMDDLIDLEIEKIDKIIEKIESDPEPEEVKFTELQLWKNFKRTCIAGRRTGLGITALGDTFAALNIKYGSKKSIEMTDKIYKHLAVYAYKSSCIMAGERGCFPIYEYELEKNNAFIQNIIEQDKELLQLYKKHGRRNIALTTTAPTGSVSTMTQTSSGIEPVFLLSYVRRKKLNPSDKNIRVDFTDALGDKWQEFTVYHHGVKKWMDVTGEFDITKSPYHGATSDSVDWISSVDIQAAAQKWICHSISKTCNLPASATKELVSDVYIRAWESGCKGFTVYRDGSRSGVLISTEAINDKKQLAGNERPKSIQPSVAPKRPVELVCEIKKAKVQGEQWTLLIGLFDNKPYEVFAGLSKFIDIPNKYKTGKIVKNGKIDGVSTYNLTLGEGDDMFVIKNISDVFDNPNNESLTRSVSLSLRHGIPAQFIVEQLQKDKRSEMTSLSKVLARVLKSYIKDGTASTAEKICPSCKQEGSLFYQEGCVSCKCGYSKCG